MKRSIGIIAALAVIPAQAAQVRPSWHITTSDCESVAKGKIHEPYEDPYARIVIRNNLTCKGNVTVPDEKWATGWQLKVGAKLAGRGESIKLKPGCYTGTWVKDQIVLSEEEHFCITNTQGTVKVAWLFTGRNGATKKVYKVPAGCSFRSGYKWVQGSTWIKLKNRSDGGLLIPLPGGKTKMKASPPGFYKPFDHSYRKGLTCQA